MKKILKLFSNELLIMLFSLSLFLIGVFYSDDPGFSTRDNLSSGGDDFDLFMGFASLSIWGFIFASINLLVNNISFKTRKKIIHLSFYIYNAIIIMQLFGLFLINLDTPLTEEFLKYDLFSVWISIYIVGIIIIFINTILTRKNESEFTIIKIKWFQKIFVGIAFVIFLFNLWIYFSFLPAFFLSCLFH